MSKFFRDGREEMYYIGNKENFTVRLYINSIDKDGQYCTTIIGLK